MLGEAGLLHYSQAHAPLILLCRGRWSEPNVDRQQREKNDKGGHRKRGEETGTNIVGEKKGERSGIKCVIRVENVG